MYRSLMSCIRVNSQYSDLFDCPTGVRQGCVLSPTLFAMFINQLSNQMSEKGKHGIQLLPGVMEIFILLFADDVALLSTTPSGLQNQLNILQICCQNMKLQVNEVKTKIMVFRMVLGKREIWYYNGTEFDIVNKYCYLGFHFSTKISPQIATHHLVAKGKKALICLVKTFQKYKEMTFETYFKIFDSKIKSILLYSSEVWGLHKLDSIEKVHMLACKCFLGVPMCTPNNMIYGDLGRYPLYINCLLYTSDAADE
eukprot:TRINITY_DN32826_c0_g1_i3.p1 TRINITY_DN32826_c0_g1~~TRINITY_DN32826_c0_g1_i3.p1  ORF type:complete len:254 (-),score=11.51 TRINITY_DN32826_c0_g1_i3:14-775(-)